MSFGASGSSSDQPLAGFKKFVSEDEIEEKKRQRQEEWEKVRTPDQPLEAPEEAYDPRCLYDKLQEQKQKKQDDHDEQFKLKNQVKGLETDEADFLDYVSQQQMQVSRVRQQEDDKVLNEYRNAVTSHVAEVASSTKPAVVIKKPSLPSGGKKSQQALLAGAVKRKGSDSQSSPDKKARVENQDDEVAPDSTTDSNPATESMVSAATSDLTNLPQAADSTTPRALVTGPQIAQVVGILPGLGAYTDTSDSDSASSDSDIELPPDVFSKKFKVIHVQQGH